MGRHKKRGRKKTLTPKLRELKQNEQTRNWKKLNQTSCNLTLNKTKDVDIIEWLATKPNKQQYIRELIRSDMANSK